MKIEIEIPDWATKHRILIISGSECVAQKLPHQNFWMVKETRCNQCGECCLDYPSTPFGVDDEGKCLKLKLEDGKCICLMEGSDKPIRCIIDPNLRQGYEYCSMTHKRVDIK